jgi:hypothetical protein
VGSALTPNWRTKARAATWPEEYRLLAELR